jgi:hypothetical protein
VRDTVLIITLSLFCNMYIYTHVCVFDFHNFFFFFEFTLLSLPSSNLDFITALSLPTLMVI